MAILMALKRPIANTSKIFSKSQRNYSKIQKEVLAIVFAVKKFFQYFFDKNLSWSYHKPLLAIYGKKKSLGMVENRLACCHLNQFNFQIEYRRTADHQNADALSRLPFAEDKHFDEEESAGAVDIVCAISTLTFQMEKYRIQRPYRSKQQRMLSFLKSSAPQTKDGSKRTTTSILRNTKTCTIPEHPTPRFAISYQSCDPQKALPSSAPATLWRTLWYPKNKTACQNRCLLAKY